MPLTSELGIRQILWMGSTVPMPAPYEVLQALTSVEVTNDNEAGDGFQLVFHCTRTDLDYGLLKHPAFAPGTRVIIGVILGIIPEVLIDGVITHHQVKVERRRQRRADRHRQGHHLGDGPGGAATAASTTSPTR